MLAPRSPGETEYMTVQAAFVLASGERSIHDGKEWYLGPSRYFNAWQARVMRVQASRSASVEVA
jgi:hypothetical protein